MKKYTLNDFLAGKVDVRFVTKENAMKLLKECEKHGIICNNGKKIREHFPPDPVLSVNFFGNGRLTHGFEIYPHRTVIDFDELIWNPKNRYQIIIDCDGDTTTAKMIINGKEVKTSKAKRNPADKFNWKLAADLAYGRLFGGKEIEKPKKRPGVFHVGDRVVCTGEQSGNTRVIGKHGRVVVVDGDDELSCGVEFDVRINGHDCLGKAEYGCGYWMHPSNLRHE